MAIPKDRTEFTDWCLRKLGQGVIEINLLPEQIDDRVDEALLMFQQFHIDAVEKCWLSHQMTVQDIANKFIQIPPPVISVTGIVPLNNSNRDMGMFDVRYQMLLSDIYTFTSTSILHYHMMMQHLDLLDFEFNVHNSVRFNRHQQKLFIELDWNDVQVGSYFIIECYRILNPDDYPDVWNDIWLKDYTVCLLKLQWATNLQKYNGVALLGGVTLNGSELYQQASAEKDKLEAKLESTFCEPPSFIIG